MSIKESEEIILEVSSEKEFKIRTQEALNREMHPVLQALILINMFRSLEELAQKASDNHEPEEAALISLLSSYANILDNLWITTCLDMQPEVETYFALYQSERDLFKSRFLYN